MRSSRGEPDGRIRRALERWLVPDTAGLLLAVSGGPDSTALMHAAAAMPRRRPIHVATVDHGLRPEAADEARQVARAAKALGLPHETLRRAGDPPIAAIQAAARAARYRLLAEHAGRVGATAVLTGHTRDDQAETVLMRLIAGSGPAGLAGMSLERDLVPGVTLGRPFLAIPKADLTAWCEGRGLAFTRDPSNGDDRFGRVRLRRLMPLLEREGLTADRLVKLAERAARYAAAIEAAARVALDAAILLPSEGPKSSAGSFPLSPAGEGSDVSREVVPRSRPSPTRGLPFPAEGGGEGVGSTATGDAGLSLHGRAIAALPEAVALCLVDRVLDQAGGALPSRLERLERLVLDHLLPALRQGRPVRRTLRGLAIAADAAGIVTVRAAPPRRNAGLAAGGVGLLGKGKPSAYIGSERADGPTASGTRPTRPRD